MKKIFITLPVILLLAAGCNSHKSQTNDQTGTAQPPQAEQTTPIDTTTSPTSTSIAKSTTTPGSDTAWKNTVLNQLVNLTDWKQTNLQDWQFADSTLQAQHEAKMKTFGTGKILMLSKTFNSNGCQSDCKTESDTQKNLELTVSKTLANFNWQLISWQYNPGMYTDYLYTRSGHPLIFQIGLNESEKGGMFVNIEFLY